MRRSHHPYMSATYINGYCKDIPLRNLSLDQTLSQIDLINNQFGRRALSHAENKTISNGQKSIQGKWVNDDRWVNYPKH